MSAMSERYDRAARRYGIWWAPVLEASALRVLDRVAEAWPADGQPGAILDLGTGTGTLALEAARRWPAATVSGIDASRGMILAARQRAREDLPASDARPLSCSSLPIASPSSGKPIASSGRADCWPS